MKRCFMVRIFLYVLTAITTLSISACSKENEAEHPQEAWLRESFLLEAYTEQGEDPYLREDGTSASQFPLGVNITGNDMLMDEGWLYSFSDDGILYYLRSNDQEWTGYFSYEIQGNQLKLSSPEGDYGFFFPSTQVLPPGYNMTGETNEILKKTDTELCIKSTWTCTENATLIVTTNFRRISLGSTAN